MEMGLDLLSKLWGTIGSVARAFTPSFLREADKGEREKKRMEQVSQGEENSFYSPHIENYLTPRAQNTTPTPLYPNTY